jgi:hypothetical protein
MRLLFIILFCWATLSFSQSEWQVIEFDSWVSFSFPAFHKESDTLSQHDFHADGEFGLMQSVKIPQPQAQITNEQELIAYYNAFQEMSISQNNGDLIEDSTTRLNELYIRHFTFENIWNNSSEVQENMVLMLHRNIYSFTYAYLKTDRFKAQQEINKFFGGITISNVDLDDQLTIPNKSERQGEAVGKVFRYILAGVIVVATVLILMKKYKPVIVMKNILSLVLLTWGAVCLFLYVVNLLFDVNRTLLLTSGIGCLITGYVLRKIVLPGENRENKTGN